MVSYISNRYREIIQDVHTEWLILEGQSEGRVFEERKA